MPNGSEWNAMYVNCVFVWLFVCLSVRLSVCPFVRPCVCLSVCVWLVVCRLVRMLFVCLYAACIICIKRALWMYLTCAFTTPRKLPHVMFQTVAAQKTRHFVVRVQLAQPILFRPVGPRSFCKARRWQNLGQHRRQAHGHLSWITLLTSFDSVTFWDTQCTCFKWRWC